LKHLLVGTIADSIVSAMLGLLLKCTLARQRFQLVLSSRCRQRKWTCDFWFTEMYYRSWTLCQPVVWSSKQQDGACQIQPRWLWSIPSADITEGWCLTSGCDDCDRPQFWRASCVKCL